MNIFGLLNPLDFDQVFSSCGENLFHSNDHPRYEQWIENDKLFIQFALAGYKKQNLFVEQTGELLSVGAKKQVEEKERRLAARAFTVKFTNPKGQWDFGKVVATYKDGLLLLEVPPTESKKPTSVPILPGL